MSAAMCYSMPQPPVAADRVPPANCTPAQFRYVAAEPHEQSKSKGITSETGPRCSPVRGSPYLVRCVATLGRPSPDRTSAVAVPPCWPCPNWLCILAGVSGNKKGRACPRQLTLENPSRSARNCLSVRFAPADALLPESAPGHQETGSISVPRLLRLDSRRFHGRGLGPAAPRIESGSPQDH